MEKFELKKRNLKKYFLYVNHVGKFLCTSRFRFRFLYTQNIPFQRKSFKLR